MLSNIGRYTVPKVEALDLLGTKVHYKGAIDPSYFLHCTERFVNSDAAPHAVLLDLGPNLFGTGATDDLVALLRALLLFDPSRRLSAKEALEHPFFDVVTRPN